MSSNTNVADSCVVLCCAVEEEAIHAIRLFGKDVKDQPLRLGQRIWDRKVGIFDDFEIHVLITGIGMVNASCALTALVAECCVGNNEVCVINFGCAGAHDDDVNVGDVVIASHLVPIGVYKLRPNGSKVYGGFKSIVGAPMINEISSNEWLKCKLEEAVIRLHLAHHIGRIGSADAWTQEASSLIEMNSSLNTLCEDMESSALAQVCMSFGISFACVKDISNNELQTPTSKTPGAKSSLDLSNIGYRSAVVAVNAAKMVLSRPAS